MVSSAAMPRMVLQPLCEPHIPGTKVWLWIHFKTLGIDIGHHKSPQLEENRKKGAPSRGELKKISKGAYLPNARSWLNYAKRKFKTPSSTNSSTASWSPRKQCCSLWLTIDGCQEWVPAPSRCRIGDWRREYRWRTVSRSSMPPAGTRASCSAQLTTSRRRSSLICRWPNRSRCWMALLLSGLEKVARTVYDLDLGRALNSPLTEAPVFNLCWANSRLAILWNPRSSNFRAKTESTRATFDQKWRTASFLTSLLIESTLIPVK